MKKKIHPLEFADLARDILVEGNSIKFKATGRSMYPFILDGDIVTAIGIKPKNLKIGDVVLYTHKNETKAHRLIKKAGNTFKIKGDSDIAFHDTIRAEDILGKVISVEHLGKIKNPDKSRFAAILWSKFQPKIRRIQSVLKKSR